MQRKYGGIFWEISKSVIVFMNDEYLGDDRALEKHISKKYRFTLTKDWYEMGKCNLAEYLGNKMSKFVIHFCWRKKHANYSFLSYL